jgi:hypothetical protein
MANVRPVVFFLIALGVLWLGMELGNRIRGWRGKSVEGEDKLISVLEGALLTLFGLLIGFTFSMAVSRYDLRKAVIVKEANAIGTTWLRTATLAEPTRTEQQTLLRQYVLIRKQFLAAGHNSDQESESLRRTGELQARLWAAASSYAAEHRDAITGLYLSTLNDSIDASEERTAADENRIPAEGWGMLLLVGFIAMVLVGLDVRSKSRVLQALLPLALAWALGLTMDLDSPRYGLIRVDQPSMERLAQQVAGSPPQQAP